MIETERRSMRPARREPRRDSLGPQHLNEPASSLGSAAAPDSHAATAHFNVAPTGSRLYRRWATGLPSPAPANRNLTAKTLLPRAALPLHPDFASSFPTNTSDKH